MGLQFTFLDILLAGPFIIASLAYRYASIGISKVTGRNNRASSGTYGLYDYETTNEFRRKPRRQLTQPSPSAQSVVSVKPLVADQSRCRLLYLLPLDVRLIVYELILGQAYLHISQLQGFVCRLPHVFEDSVHGICHDQTQLKKGFLPLLLSCRQMYVLKSPIFVKINRSGPEVQKQSQKRMASVTADTRFSYTESIDLLYKTNTFEFTTPECFRSFCHAMPDHRLLSLRKIYLYWSSPRRSVDKRLAEKHWCDLWMFFSNNLSHLHLLSVSLGNITAETRARLGDKFGDESSWLLPVAKAVDNSAKFNGIRLIQIVVGSGYSGQMTTNGPDRNPVELQSVIIDLSKAFSSVDREKSLQEVNQRVKDARWNHRPYGRMLPQ